MQTNEIDVKDMEANLHAYEGFGYFGKLPKNAKKHRAFAPQKNVLKKATEDFLFAIGGINGGNEDMTSSIERLDLSKMKWETLENVKLPQKIGYLNCVLHDGMVHCLGGENNDEIKFKTHFIIDLKHLLPKNYEQLRDGAIDVFCNWLRESGFHKIEGKGIGGIVSKYAGSLWGNYDKLLGNS